MIEIFEITEVDDFTLDAVNHLLPQLSQSAQPISSGSLEDLARSEATRLFMAKEGNAILGMLSLVVFAIPTGIKAWIEDVVVEEDARGKGVGKKLMMHAMAETEKAGAKSIDLTSRPSRESANQLYQSIGFEVRETNVYRHHSKC